MSVQLIIKEGRPEYAVLPYDVYVQLVEDAEMLEDIHDYDRIKAAIERGEEELVPVEVVSALVNGENPIRVWREFRGMNQQQLAQAVGISIPYLSQMEAGKRQGSLQVLKAFARALNLTLDDLVSENEK